MVKLLLLANILSNLFLTCVNAYPRFAYSYEDHMVLQRAPQKAVIWGFADNIGDVMTVAIEGHGSAQGTVTKNPHGKGGVWKVKLPAMTEPGPFKITGTSNEGRIMLHDVLFGDVWLCSGQSNMAFSMREMFNSTTEIADGLTYDKVRIFRAQLNQSPTVLNDLKSVAISWSSPNQNNLPYFSAICFLFGKHIYNDRKYPIGLVESDWGGTPIETWSSPEALQACPIQKTKRYSWGDSGCWNAMIVPLLPMTITGALWYQGESNTGRTKYYNCQQQHMIDDWRKRFNEASLGETRRDFYFGYVQLAAFRNNDNMWGFPDFRWQQTAGHGFSPNKDQKNVFMAVAMDLPDFDGPKGPIHPRDKQDVAERMSLSALAVAYGEKVEYQGPFPASFTANVKSHRITINYDKDIEVRSNKGFEVCCGNTCGDWVAAPLVSNSDHSVDLDVSGCGTRHLVGLRYAWRETPCLFKKCPIYGKNTNLPGPSFVKIENFESAATIIG